MCTWSTDGTVNALVAWVKKGRVVASLPPIPLELLPPYLLTIHDRAVIWAVSGAREVLKAATSPHCDGLELRSIHSGLTYLMQLGKIMKIYVLQLWEFQDTSWMASTYFVQKLCFHREYVAEVTTTDDVKSLKARQGIEP